MDALSEVFRTIHLEQTNCCQIEVAAPWGLQVEKFDGAVFWVVLRGSCWLEVDGIETALPLVGGDLIVLPQGQRYTLRDSPTKTLPRPLESPVLDFDTVLQTHADEAGVVRIGSGGLPTTLMYGYLQFEPLSENPILSALPPLIVIKGEDGQAVEWLNTTMQFMASEMASDRPGSQTVINHLAGILFVQAVRAYIANQGCSSRCWLRALTHPQIGTALSLIHRHPETAWTIEQLAAQVNMSRTAFFVEFRNLVGEPPSKYLTRWRMHRASQFLRAQHLNLSDVASLTGYESEAAFSKAFKRWLGQSPGAYRQANRALAS